MAISGLEVAAGYIDSMEHASSSLKRLRACVFLDEKLRLCSPHRTGNFGSGFLTEQAFCKTAESRTTVLPKVCPQEKLTASRTTEVGRPGRLQRAAWPDSKRDAGIKSEQSGAIQAAQHRRCWWII